MSNREYAWPWTENSSRTAPGRAAGQSAPGGIRGSLQSAAARARTRAGSVTVAARGRISRAWAAVSRSTTWSGWRAPAHSRRPADAARAPPGPVARGDAVVLVGVVVLAETVVLVEAVVPPGALAHPASAVRAPA